MEFSIEKFAERMQYKLDKNKYKESYEMNPRGRGRSWTNCKTFWLLYRLRQETLELEEAIANHEVEAAMDEAADVGNFAMMIFDKLSRTSTRNSILT